MCFKKNPRTLQNPVKKKKKKKSHQEVCNSINHFSMNLKVSEN